MTDYSKLKKNPSNTGWVMGWLVFDDDNKVFDSIYESQEEAMARTEELGKPYAVSYGSNLPGTDDYILEDYPQ
jgi:hypothetical protein